MYSKNSLTERELVLDLMTSEEHLNSLYNGAVIQSSCPILREILSECLANAQDVQYSLSNIVEKSGWNKVQIVKSREVEGMVQKYSNLI